LDKLLDELAKGKAMENIFGNNTFGLKTECGAEVLYTIFYPVTIS
jgi:hypothetical protein